MTTAEDSYGVVLDDGRHSTVWFDVFRTKIHRKWSWLSAANNARTIDKMVLVNLYFAEIYVL